MEAATKSDYVAASNGPLEAAMLGEIYVAACSSEKLYKDNFKFSL